MVNGQWTIINNSQITYHKILCHFKIKINTILEPWAK